MEIKHYTDYRINHEISDTSNVKHYNIYYIEKLHTVYLLLYKPML